MTFSRRRLLQTAVAAALPLRRSFAATLPAIGVQLYTVRSVIEKNPSETLNAIQEIGYTEVEILYASLDKIGDALAKTRLKPVSAHVDGSLFTPDNSSKLDAALATLKAKGCSFAVYPYVAPQARHGETTFKELADTLNRGGAACKKAGLKLCYHNHAFEFQPYGSKTGFEIMMDATDKKLVGLEMDAFWVSVGGHDPAKLLAQYKGRVDLLHVKDKADGTAQMFGEGVPRTAFKEAGKGILKWPEIFRAAKKSGVKHYFVEQDQTPGNPIDSLRTSFQYLHGLQF